MRRRRVEIAALTLVMLLLFAGVRAGPPIAEAAPNASAVAPKEGDARVLLELFTSEGCSSCPPADDAVSALARTQPVPGARVIVLSHHVDYWNDLGWPDPFSSADATQRQRSYMHLRGGLYTPQAVVDGSAQMIGSREGAIERAVAAAAKRAHAQIDIEVTAPAPARGVFDVTIKVAALPDTSTDAELLVAMAQDRASIVIGRGENGGRTLDHVAIARSMKMLAAVPSTGTAATTVVQLPPTIGTPPSSSFSVVAFVQERGSRRVLGSAAASLVVRP